MECGKETPHLILASFKENEEDKAICLQCFWTQTPLKMDSMKKKYAEKKDTI